ncbi:MAG: phosphopentomutase [Clostridiaceae bacterium]|nr:phosphopentomutase [Clostridiaceae bacterium]
MKRFIVIVMDSAGIGELPDSREYGDEGSNTIGHISRLVKDFSLPNLERLGLANIDGFSGTYRTTTDLKSLELTGSYGKMAEKSAGKDTTTGHWELAGIILDKPFPLFPNGFPDDLVKEFERRIGRKTLGNKPASGTVIIQELGDEHVKTGFPIIYTSADSVFQVAAHEDVIPVEEQYRICRTAREMLTGDYGVGRVIARPFTGKSGNYTRTDRRKDFSIRPPEKTVLNYLSENGYEVRAVGKIEDIFSGSGITRSVKTHSNADGIDRTIEWIREEYEGMLFTNLVDFDMKYGHRNDVEGYAKALAEFDRRLPEITGHLKDEDILIITADHGCDPSTTSTDHSREYVPLLVTGKHVRKGVNMHVRNSFADVAKTIAEYFGIENSLSGESFLNLII